MEIIETLIRRMDLKTLRSYAGGNSRWGEAARAEMARRREAGSMTAALEKADTRELNRIVFVREPGDPIREEARRILDERTAEWLLDGREDKC